MNLSLFSTLCDSCLLCIVTNVVISRQGSFAVEPAKLALTQVFIGRTRILVCNGIHPASYLIEGEGRCSFNSIG